MSRIPPEDTLPTRGGRFRLRCWGARGTVPSPGQRTVRYGGNTSCVEVRSVHEDLVILDAGTGIRALGQRLEPDTPAHVFLTHRHSDHVIGLPHFAPLFDSSRTVHVHCGNADAATTRAVIDTLLSPPLFPPLPSVLDRLDVHGITDGAPVDIAGRCTVHRFPARHPGEAAVFRVDDAKGAGVAYAPDNELDYASTDPDVIAWRRGLTLALHGVPVLLHDATYTDQELPSHRGWGHSSALEATRFAMECVAGLLVLFHHHPDRSDEQMDAIVQECRELVAYSGSSLRVIAAWEGLTLTV
jgi:phosphoribosyl 1,2-cyclic phosphodiesterase